MKKILLVIDCQYSFLDGGELEVKGSTNIMENLMEYIKKHGRDCELVIATCDWHPITHCSFKENGGIWPMHCLQYSHGAAIYNPLLLTLNEHTNNFITLTKGLDEDHEEYSIFKNKNSCDKITNIIQKLNIDEIDVCGIAYDVCVMDSVKDGLIEYPNVKFNVIKKFCPSIGNGKEFDNFLKNSERTTLK